MSDTLAPLILDLLEWIAAGPRSYAEVMEAWRTSCPRLTVWEDALDHVSCWSRLTPLGRRFLAGSSRRPK